MVDLIVQGCLRLMEDRVLIRCKKEDEKTVQAVLQQTEQKFAQTVKRQTNADKKVVLSVDSTAFLPPNSAGGVIVMTIDTKIKVVSIHYTISITLKNINNQLF